MFCAISGQVPEQPVVSTKTGRLFEKRLIEKYIQETGKDPVSGDELAVADLLDLQTNKAPKPRTSPAASIPGLLGLFHDEWDAVMLEVHTLRQQLHATKQELSHALYQHDAACRVIARLNRERDELKSALEQLQDAYRSVAANAAAEAAEAAAAAAAAAKRAAAAEAEEGAVAVKKQRQAGLTEEILQELQNISASLSKGRKKRTLSPGLATVEELARFSELGSFPLHKTISGGITCIDTNPGEEKVVATAGADGTVQVYSLSQQQQLQSLEGHSKRVTCAAYVDSSVLVSTSADRTTRLWRADEEGVYKCSSVMKEHAGEVVGVTVHPSRHYFITAGADRSWCFYDVETCTCLKQVAYEQVKEPYTCVQLHPDGLILGTGTRECVIRIWEVKGQKNVASFEGHASPITALSFSENGYYLATAAADCVKLWDLRKLKNFKTLTPYEDEACNAVAFDHSGLYLAVGGADACIYSVKQDWQVVTRFQDVPKKGVLSLEWGKDAHSLLVGASDHNLRVFGTADS